MARTSVVILSSHSLFAEGVANRLREYLQQVDLEIVNPRQPDVMLQLAAARPSIVILDVTDSSVAQVCSLSELLLSLPDLKVVRLDLEHDRAQVVTSEQRPAVKVRDLVEVINGST